ncbi:hypothetical protein [Streptomyces sp. NPDC089919]|uniref:hypothetical protein n=1 Tax=Streptomyces sp. NPDC089919 TaxID=3155188 RepID=UPI00343D27CC
MEHNPFTYENHQFLMRMDPPSIVGLATYASADQRYWPLFQLCLEWHLKNTGTLTPDKQQEFLLLLGEHTTFTVQYETSLKTLTDSVLCNNSDGYRQFLDAFYYEANTYVDMGKEQKLAEERRRHAEKEMIRRVEDAARKDAQRNLAVRLAAQEKQDKERSKSLAPGELSAYWLKRLRELGATDDQQRVLADLLKVPTRAQVVLHIIKMQPAMTGAEFFAMLKQPSSALTGWQVQCKKLAKDQGDFTAISKALAEPEVMLLVRHMAGAVKHLPDISAGIPPRAPRGEAPARPAAPGRSRPALYTSERHDLSSYPMQNGFAGFWRAWQEGQGDYLASFLDYWLRGATGMFAQAGFTGDELGIAAYRAASERRTRPAGERILALLHEDGTPLAALPDAATVQDSFEATYDTWRAVLVERNQERMKKEGYRLGEHAAEVIAKGRNRQYTMYQKAMWEAIDGGLPRVVAGLKKGWPALKDVPLKPFLPVDHCPDEESGRKYNEFAVKHQLEYLDKVDMRLRSAQEAVLRSPSGKGALDQVTEQLLQDNLDLPGRTTYAVKSVPSLLSKMLGDAGEARFANLIAPYGKLAGNARDSMRCTLTVETPAMLATAVNELVDHLLDVGWKCVQFKNCIVDPLSGGYRGVNSQWSRIFGEDETDALFTPAEQTALGGREAIVNRKIYFELQFHTPDSFFAKDAATHHAYEQHRTLTRQLSALTRELSELEEAGAAETERLTELQRRVEVSTTAIKALNVSLMELTLPREVGEKIRSIPGAAVDTSFFTGIER